VASKTHHRSDHQAPQGHQPQKTPVPVDFLREIPHHFDATRYENLCDLVRIYTLLDTLVRAEELIAIRLDEYDRRTGILRITHPKGGGGRAVQLSRTAQRLVSRHLDLRQARAKQRGYELGGDDPFIATIHDTPPDVLGAQGDDASPLTQTRAASWRGGTRPPKGAE
jgi:integrase